jgi:fibronectin type 3 domain-containing protein
MTVSGSGVAPVQHSVSLSWAASTSGVIVYNVYRGSVSGGPYARVSSNDTGLSYTDSAVSGGQTYYYVVTAVDSTGTESTYSNQVQAVVPSP